MPCNVNHADDVEGNKHERDDGDKDGDDDDEIVGEKAAWQCR